MQITKNKTELETQKASIETGSGCLKHKCTVLLLSKGVKELKKIKQLRIFSRYRFCLFKCAFIVKAASRQWRERDTNY